MSLADLWSRSVSSKFWICGTIMAPKINIPFEMIPRSDVPSRLPVARPVGSRRGSQWDDVLRALEADDGTHAVKIIEPDRQTRRKLQATLRTIGKNWGLYVEMREHNGAIYAWITERAGRFSPPEN